MIRAQAKRIIQAVYAYRCGYCGVTETQAGSTLTFDHFRPQSQGGTDDTANLVYSCHACNEFKGEYWAEGAESRLLHPLVDDINQHIVEEMNGTLRALTPLGQVYLDRLQLNRFNLIKNRLEQQRLTRIEDRIAEMNSALESILSALKKHES